MNNVHFAIPEIYGESLSYYEVLRKLVDKTNELIDNYNTVPEQIAEEVKNLDASQLFSAVLNQLIHSIATDNTKSANAVKVYKKHDLLYATFNETVNLYESLIDFTTGAETELIPGTNISEVNISELFIELRKLIDDESQTREQADTTLQQNINTEASAREQADQQLQTMLSSPYNFKGEVSSLSALPASGEVNDTYYVQDVKYKVTWTGSAWVQSSLSEAEYQTELSELKGDLDNLNDDISDIINNNKEKVNEIPFVFINKTVSGITIKQNEDGTISLTGTATNSFDLPLSNEIYGLGNKTVVFYGEALGVYLYETGVGAIRINDNLKYFSDGNSFVIPEKSSYKLARWIEKGVTYNQTISFKLYDGNNVSRNKNDIADYNEKLDKNFNNINKSLSCEDLISESDNLLTDSIFNNAVDGLTKNGIEFNFNNAVVDTFITNIFNEFTLEKGEYSLLIASENKLSNNLYFAIQDENTTTNIYISPKSGTNLNAVHFSLKDSVTFVNCGFFGNTTSYHLTGKIKLALIKGNVDRFSYKINDEIELLKSEINGLENEIIFYDDFNNPYLNKNVWCIETGNVRNIGIEDEYYREENVSIENGCLKITAKKEEFEGKQFTSGAVQSIKGFQFGMNTRVTAKIKLENFGDGGWPAFWSYGGQINYKRQTWPVNGEIDIFELWKQSGSGYATTALHYGVNNSSVYSDINLKYFDDNWHIWSMEWIENSISVYCDDELVYTFNTAETLDNNGYSCFNDKAVNHRLIFNIAIDKNKLSGNTPDEMYMYVDYVKVEAINFKKSNYLQFESSNITCNVGDEIIVIALPDVECSDKTVLWYIEDETVIEHKYKQFDNNAYSNYGTFIAMKSGTTSITVKDKYGNCDTCKITVN